MRVIGNSPLGWEPRKEPWHFHCQFYTLFRRPMGDQPPPRGTDPSCPRIGGSHHRPNRLLRARLRRDLRRTDNNPLAPTRSRHVAQTA
jgi:hypothetical protein